ncbi:HEAT repeat domain-containing protein [Longimicrobium sp.]|uniref:HEAT repeat domain-containing protein n=1 Tax=Longimicrobium sp. TaxID=2029185 RepID=UPI003B3A3143
MPLKWLMGLFEQDAPEHLEASAVLPEGAAESWDGRLMTLLADAGARDPGRADAAARELRNRVERMDAPQWVRADDALRHWLRIYYRAQSPAWLGGTEDVRALRLPADAEAAVVGLLGAHHSGYIREAAVRRLALVRGGDEMPPLLLRANDWVPQVRGLALDALRARLSPTYAEAWVRWLHLVLRLGGRGSADARPLVDAVMELLRAPECADAVWAGLGSPDRTVRRTCFGILERAGGTGLRPLAQAALGSNDVVLRRHAVRVADALDDASLRTVLPALVRDPLPGIRRDALGLAARRAGADALPWLREALLDSAGGVRAEARAALQRLSPVDFAAFYREQVAAGGARLAAAVAGLGETGGEPDAESVCPLLGDPLPRVRAAAVRALARLGGTAALPTVLAAVADASPSVSRAAAAAVLDGVRTLGIAPLGALMRDGRAHVRQSALSLLVARGKWESIPWILRALVDPDERIRRYARTYLRQWNQRFNRVASQPTPEQLAEFGAALEQAADAVDPQMRDWLRFAAGLPR